VADGARELSAQRAGAGVREVKQMRARTGTEWLGRLARLLKKHNVDVELGTPEAAAVLQWRGGAEGWTMPGDDGATILFRDAVPTISVVLEEVAHALQAAQHRFEDMDAMEMNCHREIEAKQCLIDRRERLGIPEVEDQDTREQLAREHRELERLQER
jgi:hypothetical protein